MADMPEEMFEIVREDGVGILQLSVPMDLDPMVIDRLIVSINEAMDARPEPAWVMDLTRVTYLNSAGLGFLCNLREKIRQSGGKLALFGLSQQLMHLFRSCCLERLFTISRTRAEALKAVAN